MDARCHEERRGPRNPGIVNGLTVEQALKFPGPGKRRRRMLTQRYTIRTAKERKIRLPLLGMSCHPGMAAIASERLDDIREWDDEAGCRVATAECGGTEGVLPARSQPKPFGAMSSHLPVASVPASDLHCAALQAGTGGKRGDVAGTCMGGPARRVMMVAQSTWDGGAGGLTWAGWAGLGWAGTGASDRQRPLQARRGIPGAVSWAGERMDWQGPSMPCGAVDGCVERGRQDPNLAFNLRKASSKLTEAGRSSSAVNPGRGTLQRSSSNCPPLPSGSITRALGPSRPAPLWARPTLGTADGCKCDEDSICVLKTQLTRALARKGNRRKAGGVFLLHAQQDVRRPLHPPPAPAPLDGLEGWSRMEPAPQGLPPMRPPPAWDARQLAAAGWASSQGRGVLEQKAMEAPLWANLSFGFLAHREWRREAWEVASEQMCPRSPRRFQDRTRRGEVWSGLIWSGSASSRFPFPPGRWSAPSRFDVGRGEQQLELRGAAAHQMPRRQNQLDGNLGRRVATTAMQAEASKYQASQAQLHLPDIACNAHACRPSPGGRNHMLAHTHSSPYQLLPAARPPSGAHPQPDAPSTSILHHHHRDWTPAPAGLMDCAAAKKDGWDQPGASRRGARTVVEGVRCVLIIHSPSFVVFSTSPPCRSSCSSILPIARPLPPFVVASRASSPTPRLPPFFLLPAPPPASARSPSPATDPPDRPTDRDRRRVQAPPDDWRRQIDRTPSLRKPRPRADGTAPRHLSQDRTFGSQPASVFVPWPALSAFSFSTTPKGDCDHCASTLRRFPIARDRTPTNDAQNGLRRPQSAAPFL
ncbi:hypothetical protein Purlil1_4508 [Purpureocillium lilacinum]|uniref:Uncharacterized protein n=1 Tax=Purpureocillium lilacinum TaxID=33203 RepID=A0ABR0C3F4_PURLI|nr:hypothetical protein Purlil1_4508 [Purpureocillium lilacinum]